MRRWRAFVRAYRGAHRGRTVGFRGSRLVGAQERAPRGRSGGCAGARGAARGVACGSDHSRGGCGRGVLRGVCRRGGRGSLVVLDASAAGRGDHRDGSALDRRGRRVGAGHAPGAANGAARSLDDGAGRRCARGPCGFGGVRLVGRAARLRRRGAVVAGVSAFVSVWTGSPWAAGVAGAAAAALAAPVGRAAADGGMAAALAGLQSAIGPEVVLAAGCALLAAAVATARRATIARLESA